MPKEILRNAVKNHLMARLVDFGFSFSESSLKITRKKGDFVNEISFRGSRTNTSNLMINFEASFNIFSSYYKKWHKANFPDLPILGAGYLYPERDAYLHRYNRALQPSFGYDFMKLDHKVIMDDLYGNIVRVAIPFFDDNDTWDKMATNTISDGVKKFDSLMISNRIAEARAYCLKNIELYEEEYGSSISGHASQIQTYFLRRREFLLSNYPDIR